MTCDAFLLVCVGQVAAAVALELTGDGLSLPLSLSLSFASFSALTSLTSPFFHFKWDFLECLTHTVLESTRNGVYCIQCPCLLCSEVEVIWPLSLATESDMQPFAEVQLTALWLENATGNMRGHGQNPPEP